MKYSHSSVFFSFAFVHVSGRIAIAFLFLNATVLWFWTLPLDIRLLTALVAMRLFSFFLSGPVGTIMQMIYTSVVIWTYRTFRCIIIFLFFYVIAWIYFHITSYELYNVYNKMLSLIFSIFTLHISDKSKPSWRLKIWI